MGECKGGMIAVGRARKTRFNEAPFDLSMIRIMVTYFYSFSLPHSNQDRVARFEITVQLAFKLAF